jgi:hypothetical protein
VVAPTVLKRTPLTITEPKPLTEPEYTELVGVTVADELLVLLPPPPPPQATTDKATASAAKGPHDHGLSLKFMLIPEKVTAARPVVGPPAGSLGVER